MRTFIAIELPEEIKTSLARIQETLKQTGADVKWVKPENIHLTLKFLGERDEKKIEKITAVLEEVAKNKNVFAASISSIGAFPRIGSPRIIWVGIEKGDSETKGIAKELEEKIAKLGIPKETRPFSSHITIGRTRSNLNQEKLITGLKRLENEVEKQTMHFSINKITLFKSTLTPKGPVYETLKESSLKTN